MHVLSSQITHCAGAEKLETMVGNMQGQEVRNFCVRLGSGEGFVRPIVRISRVRMKDTCTQQQRTLPSHTQGSSGVVVMAWPPQASVSHSDRLLPTQISHHQQDPHCKSHSIDTKSTIPCTHPMSLTMSLCNTDTELNRQQMSTHFISHDSHQEMRRH